jgi:hypothetical protein
MIRVVHPGSLDPDFLPIPDPGRSKRHRIPDPKDWYERSVCDVAELHGLACDVRVPAPRHRGHLLHHARAWRSGLLSFEILPLFLRCRNQYYNAPCGTNKLVD